MSQSWWQILKTSGRLYGLHWKPLTRPLVFPLLKILLGVYSCLILAYWFINLITLHYRPAINQNPWLLLPVLLGLLVISCGTMFWFFKGFWEYLVYMASLNINATEISEGKPIRIREAYLQVGKQKAVSYKLLLVAYCLTPLPVALPLVCMVLLSFCLQNPALNLILFILGLLLSVAVGIVWLALLFFLSLIFQIVAFEPVSTTNPLPVFLKSSRLVWRRLPATIALQTILLVATCYVLPIPFVWLSRLLFITAPLDWFHSWLIQLILSGAAPQPGGVDILPYYNQLLGELAKHLTEITHMLSDSLLAGIITGLLLPLGTITFTLLYRDIQRPPEKTTPLS